MKKSLIFGAIALMAVVSCQPKENNPDEPTPGKEVTVSISADAQFADDYTAKVTLTLSDVAEQDVNITLAKAAVQSGKTEIPADFDKNVKIKKGEKTAVVDVSADGMGLDAGSYQAAIKIEKAEGAKVADNATVYINIDFVFKPTVNLIAPAVFPKECVAKLQVTLDKATTTDVKVKLSITPDPTIQATVASELTVPAGQTSVETDVTVTLPENIEAGSYPVVIKITEVENALVGPNKEVTIALAYPFSTDITIDGNFDDWADASIFTYTVPEGAIFDAGKVMKLAANDKYCYVYLEFTDPGWDFNYPFDMFIDHDANPNTGAWLTSYDNYKVGNPYPGLGLRWYIELGLHDGDHYNDFFSWGGVYRYDGTDCQGPFSGGLNSLGGTYDGSVIYCLGALDETNHIGRIEIQLQRKFFELTGDAACFAVKFMDGANNWDAYGMLPTSAETKIDDTGQYTVPVAVDPIKFFLPQYVE